MKRQGKLTCATEVSVIPEGNIESVHLSHVCVQTLSSFGPSLKWEKAGTYSDCQLPP